MDPCVAQKYDVGLDKMLWSEIMERLTARPEFIAPYVPSAVTTAVSPIRAPSPCGECPSGIKRSGSCNDCLAPPSHPATPKAEDIEAAVLDCLAWKFHEARRSAEEDTVGIVLERAVLREEFEKKLREDISPVRLMSQILALYDGFPDPIRTIRDRTGLLCEEVDGVVCFYEPNCPGCGLAGYDDYCSRACMLEAAGQT